LIAQGIPSLTTAEYRHRTFRHTSSGLLNLYLPAILAESIKVPQQLF